MKRRAYVSDQGPYPCYFNCGNVLPSKFRGPSIHAGWRWFTGYGSRSLHFCPMCCTLNAENIEIIRAAVYRRPKNYPTAQVEIPAWTE